MSFPSTRRLPRIGCFQGVEMEFITGFTEGGNRCSTLLSGRQYPDTNAPGGWGIPTPPLKTMQWLRRADAPINWLHKTKTTPNPRNKQTPKATAGGQLDSRGVKNGRNIEPATHTHSTQPRRDSAFSPNRWRTKVKGCPHSDACFPGISKAEDEPAREAAQHAVFR